jgi:hypothetical protein
MSWPTLFPEQEGVENDSTMPEAGRSSRTRRDSNMGGKNRSRLVRWAFTNVRQMPLLLIVFAHNT